MAVSGSGAHVQYFHADFDYEEHRRRVFAEEARSDEVGDSTEEAASCTADARWADSSHQAAAWSRFYDRHDSTPFFKARRYLTAEFPALQRSGVTVLEVGCGAGASVVPLLRHNPCARVMACDFSASAVAACARAVADAGIQPGRFCCFQADPGACDEPQQFADAVRSAAQAAGWNDVDGVDVVLAIFVLSAVVPAREAAFIAAIAAAIRPGGVLCLRDYGVGDMTQLRFRPTARRSPGAPLFQRGDATLARFYDKDELVSGVIQAAGAAGVELEADDSHWCCVSVKNRAEQLDMRRVFVHAQFTRTALP
jgi:methyltransferase-like protein 6